MSIPKPGRYPGTPMQTYHQEWEALGSSALKALLKSPANFKNRLALEPTDAMRNGTIMHALLLVQDIEPGLVVLPHGMDRRKKADKELYAELLAAAPEGSYVIKEFDYAELVKTAGKVRSTVIWQELVGDLAGCDIEVSYVFETDDVLQKFRPDAINANGLLIDLKSTGIEPYPDAFERHAHNLGYHISAAHYVAGMSSFANAQGSRWMSNDFIFLVFEQKGSHPAVAAYRASAQMLDLGQMYRDAALQTYRECEAVGLWPGLNESIEDGAIVPHMVDLEPPRWAKDPTGELYHKIGSEVFA